MSRNLVVDHDILGWADERSGQLTQTYERIFRVGIGYDLDQRSADEKVAVFCKENCCDLITGDVKAYLHYFEAGIYPVQISRFGFDAKADRHILLIRIVIG